MLVSKIKPCMSKYKQLYSETANGSLNQLSLLIVPYYLDNRGNSRANTCLKSRSFGRMYLLDKKSMPSGSLMIIITFRIACLCWRWFIQISALSTFDGRIVAYHGFNG
ncbi:unnamed protein product [Candida parapsilosis]